MRLVTSAFALIATRHFSPPILTCRLMTTTTKTYCEAAQQDDPEWHKPYHDTEYGFPIRGDDTALFERLVLEINQAGLSWLTILKKRESLQRAYSHFDVSAVAEYTEQDEARLLETEGVIRNKLKIKAAIHNAQVIIRLQKSHGSFQQWLDKQHPLAKPDWVKLFKSTFKFTGGEITKEFLVSLGYLPGAHHRGCEIYGLVTNAKPPWMDAPVDFDWKMQDDGNKKKKVAKNKRTKTPPTKEGGEAGTTNKKPSS